MKIKKEILTTGCNGHPNGDLSTENAGHIKRVSYLSVTLQNRALGHSGTYIYTYCHEYSYSPQRFHTYAKKFVT